MANLKLHELWPKHVKNEKVLRMNLPGGQNAPTPLETIFITSRPPQRPYSIFLLLFLMNLINLFPSLLSADAGNMYYTWTPGTYNMT